MKTPIKDLIARLIAYLLVGSFCLAGPLFLIVGLGAAAQRAALIFTGERADGTVIAKRQSVSSHPTYAPVFQFTAGDGRSYTASSDVYGREAEFRYGEHVRVLYRAADPESARIDAFAQLWTLPLVVGTVGAGFSFIPALILLRRRRARQTGPESIGLPEDATDAPSPALRRVLGVLFTVGGLALLAAGLGLIAPDSSSHDESRFFALDIGILFTACGVLIAQWVATGSRTYYALGGVVITSMAVMFGWIALYGNAAGFSGGVGIGGASVWSSGSVSLARIAFGIGAIVFGLSSWLAWRQVFRRDR